MAENLRKYNEKRNFEKTSEPPGEEAPARGELSYVVQHHLARRDHYDFRLEWAGALLSWAVPKGPSYDTHDKRLAIRVEDHPLDYRNFEGTIPKGEYGGGTVMLWDEGSWEPQGDVEEGLKNGALKFILKGRRLKGKWALVRLKAKEGDSKDNWLLLKEKDGFAGTSPGIAEFMTSIRTGRTMEEIGAGKESVLVKNPFSRVEAQLARLVKTAPEGEDWLYEMKYDGYRMLAYLEGGSARLVSRKGNDYTTRFPDIADSLLDLAGGRAMVLDGEVAVADPSGKTDFQALQNFMRSPRPQNLVYILFDLLALDGEDLRTRPLAERKEALEALMQGAPGSLHYSGHVRGSGKECFSAACNLGMEGIVGKKADSVYSGGRNGEWIKLKCAARQEFVIGGYTRTEKKQKGVSALLLGVYEGGGLVYAGRAGTGMDKAGREELERVFQGLEREKPPFEVPPPPRPHEEAFWLEPALVAEIKFAEWTEEGLLRQASYQGLREDKDPKDVRRESGSDFAGEPEEEEKAEEEEIMQEASESGIVIQGVKISSPDKVIFEEPEITKLDVIRYYEEVSARMLPYVGHRILSIVRCPKGISEACFYKKHPGPGSRGVVTMPVLNSEGEEEDYFYIEDASGLIFEAQMGTLEFHAWGSRAEQLEKPDMMVFDLDPDEGMALSDVRRGVLDLKSILTELSLRSYLKTSGGKGYHVVIPLKPAPSWEVFHDFAKGVAEVMEAKWPDRYTSNVRKVKRKGKIFIDWIRNARGATSVAPYSIRARKGARVSMPIAWEELDAVAPDGIDMGAALLRVKEEDPWKDFFKNAQVLK